MEQKPPRQKISESALMPTWEIAYLFPYQGDWSEAEYLNLPSNHLVEFTDGYVEFLPMPTPLHQRLVRFLFKLLEKFVLDHDLGEVLFAPLPVRLRQGKYREPDIIFVRGRDVRHSSEQFLDGADLVIEVVSGDARSRRRDFDEKPDDYAEGRVPEYWIVDPSLERITVLVLDGAAYRTHGEFGRGEQATSVTLPGFEVDVGAVFDAARQ